MRSPAAPAENPPRRPAGPLILIADRERRAGDVVAATLADEGFRTIVSAGPGEALSHLAAAEPDAVVIDAGVPGEDPDEFLRRLQWPERRPVIMVGQEESAKRTRAMNLGADDYLLRPFHPDELAARLRAVLRRTSATATTETLRLGEIVLDFERRLLIRAGEPVVLSRIEWTLLQHLARNPGKVVLHGDLLAHVWGPSYRDDVQVLRVCISRLRAKLRSSPGRDGLIRTYVGVGYALDADASGRSAGMPLAS
ncbi:MAG: response regulator transcription factor [Chloroflexi bacterium]|nr:response regulator transcription factor [Chloroflexota bacterium]